MSGVFVHVKVALYTNMICCAVGCGHRTGCGCHFYNFPSPNDGPDWENWYNIWVIRINRVNADGSLWRPEASNTKLCSCHFRPEDQWDPKSRKGGLKCKEPVYFDNNPVPASPTPSGICQQVSDEICTEGITEECGLKQPWFLGSLLKAPVESSNKSATRKRTLHPHMSGKQKESSLYKSPRMPPLKIRDYFEKQDEATLPNTDPSSICLSTSQQTARKQQYFNPNLKISKPNCSPSNSGKEQDDSEKLQVIDPEVYEVIEVPDSDDNTQESSADKHPVFVKHERADTLDDLAHAATSTCTCVQEDISLGNLKTERSSSPMHDDSILGYDAKGTLQTISVHSVECEDAHQDQNTYHRLSDFAQFIEAQPRDETPTENFEVLPRNKSQKAKISNVKPIRVFSSKSLVSNLNIHQHTTTQAFRKREEATHTNKDVQSENVYNQMFNHLMTSGSRLPQDASQANVGQENVLNIAAVLSDHQASPETSHLSLSQALTRIQELEKAVGVERFGLHRYSGSDDKIKFYTGFRSADTLMRFFWRIEPDDLTSERSSKWKNAFQLAKETLQGSGSSEDFSRNVIPYMDELFLFLCHVWLGLSPEDLADRFALPSTNYAKFIILRWIHYLKATLPGTAQSTKSNSTTLNLVRFQGQYSNTRLLLHRIKIRVQQKSVFNHLSALKHHTLVGFSPSGEVVFTSDVLSEGTSYHDQLLSSGVLSLLQSGDGVISEGGLAREDLFSSTGIAVHSLPAFELPHDPTALQHGSTSRGSHECHTEVARLLSAKYVSSLTGFKCFQSVVLFPFAHHIGDLWEVCCRLVNYQQGHRSL